MDPKRRKTQDFAEKADSTGNLGVVGTKAIYLKGEPVELNAEAKKSHFLFRKSVWRSYATNPEALEKGKSTLNSFLEQPRLGGQQLEKRGLSPLLQIIHCTLNMKVRELNRKKDIVRLILSYPPMNSANRDRHKNWIRAVSKINLKVRKMETFSSQKTMGVSRLSHQITELLNHSLDDIEAYVPPQIIKKMCVKQEINMTAAVTQHDKKLRNLAVTFATRQILKEIKNPEVRRIWVVGRDGKRISSAVKDLPQIWHTFNIWIQVDASSCLNAKGIEQNVAARLGFPLNIQKLNEFLKATSFLIFLDDISERIDLHEVGSKWWNSNNFQMIVYTTRSQEVHQRMAVDLEIRLEDHLLSWELFRLNVGKIVHSSFFQYRAKDVVQKCYGHLLAIILMARALKMAFDVTIWEHASYILSLTHGSQVKDGVLCNALAFILGRLGSTEKCVIFCAVYMEREGMNKVDLIQEWIRRSLISTFDEGEKIVEDLVNAFLLESFQNGYYVRMQDEIREVLANSQFLLQGGEGLTKAPKDEAWEEAKEIYLSYDKFSELPKSPSCPQLCALSLQKNPTMAPKDEAWEEAKEIHLMNDKFSELPNSPNCPQLCPLSLQKNPTMAPKYETWEEAKEIHLMNDKFSELPKSPNCPQLCALSLQTNPFVRVIPPPFFQHMPMLQILDLSHTKIRSLPQSLYGLAQLQQLFLRGCKLFMELPPEVGELSNLKVLDLEGTEIIRLPVDVGKLTNLTCLKMSFYEDNDNRKYNQYSNKIIPQGVISNLFQLEELIIDVNPDDRRWNANVKDIVEEVCSLDRLEALQLYLPEVLL